jgi:MFS family permease
VTTTARKAVSLWRDPSFLLLWSGQTISMLGSQVTVWALPFTAIYTLNAGAAQVGLLAAAGSAPSLLFGLPAGVWADRMRRRPLLIASDFGRALLLGSVPLAAMLGRLTMAQLYVVAFTTGALSALFEVAYRSYLPALVPRDALVGGNAKLETSATLAEMTGPGLAGALVQLVTAPIAILADALSFVVSVCTLAAIGAREPAPVVPDQPRHALREIGEGLRAVLRHPMLRALAADSGIFNLFDSLLTALYALYLTRVLGASAALAGLILVLAGLGGLLGAALAGRVTRRFGLGRAIVGGSLVAGVGELVIGLASGPLWLAAAIVVLGEGCFQAGAAVYRINGVSLRQALIPDRLQGRVNATVRFIGVGAIPLGALVAAQIGTTYGVRPAVLLAGTGTLFAFLWVFFSPIRRLRSQPAAPDEQAFAQ